jgi:hypothetical protein
MIAGRPVAIIDTETWPDISIIGLLLDDGHTHTIRQFTTMPDVGEPMQAFRDWFNAHHQEYLFIGFNSAGYDNFIIDLIMRGYDDPQTIADLNNSLFEQEDA